MRARTRLGFTIVELLVVITIISLLMALLIPAVGAARRTAREIQCVSQLRQIGLATIGFASKKDYYPGYISEMRTNDSNATGTTRIVPWFVRLLPELDGGAMYDAIQQGVDDGAGTFDSSTYLDIAVCPSDLPDTQNQPHLSYTINMGVWDKIGQTKLTDVAGWRDVKANGISHNLVGLVGRYPGIKPDNRAKIKRDAMNVRVSPSYVSSHDGTTTTLVLTENVDAGFWFPNKIIDQGQFGVVWTDGSQHGINENKGLGRDTNVTAEFARPSSEHSGVVVVTFCDGHTVRLNEEIDRQVLYRLMTPNGKESRLFSGTTPDYQKVPISDSDIGN